MTGATKKMTGVQTLLLCGLAALSACSRDSGSQITKDAPVNVKPKAPVIAKSGPSAAEQTAGMVQAASQGKSVVPVELKFDLGAKPKVGQAMEVNLALISQLSASPATVQVQANDGLTASGPTQFEIASEEAGEVYRQTVSVTPTAEGVLILGVTVALKHDEITDQRAFSIPIVAER